MDKVWTIIRVSDNKIVYQCSDKLTAGHEFKRAKRLSNKKNKFKLELKNQIK